MSNTIKNYTTEIAAEKTIGEIQKLLAKAGAKSISFEYGKEGEIDGLTFTIPVRGIPVSFRLPARQDGVYKILTKGRQQLYREDVQKKWAQQARRTAWRNVKDWLDAQLALIQMEQAELAEVFLPYAVSPSGRTLYEEFQSGNLLGSGQHGGDSDTVTGEYREIK